MNPSVETKHLTLGPLALSGNSAKWLATSLACNAQFVMRAFYLLEDVDSGNVPIALQRWELLGRHDEIDALENLK